MPEFLLGSEIQLPISDLPNTKNQELFDALKPIHQSLTLLAGMIDGRVLQQGLNAATSPLATLRSSGLNRFTCPAAVNILQGQLVYFAANVGVLNAYVANATSAQFLAMGFCSQPGGVLAGQYGEFTPFMGVNTLVSGLSTGATYYLNNSGGITITPGSVYQRVGVALSPTALLFNCMMVNEGELRVGSLSLFTTTPGLTVLSTLTSAYQKIGGWVHGSAYINFRNSSGAVINGWTIEGLPYACSISHYGWADLYYAYLGDKYYAYVQAGTSYMLVAYAGGLPLGDYGVMVAFSYPAA